MSILQIARPPYNPGRQTIQFPGKVTVSSRAQFQILNYALRLSPGQTRVMGTLIGTRSDDGQEIEVKAAYVVPITEENYEVDVDLEYYNEMFLLTRRSYPGSVIVGWFATSSDIDIRTALIHDFYSQEQGTFPYPPVLLTLQTSEAQDLDVRTYIATNIGVPAETGNCIFLPVAHTISYVDVDKSALQLVGHAAAHRDRVADVLDSTTNVDETIDEVIEQLEKVQEYVRQVVSGKLEADSDVGKALYRTLSLAPAVFTSDVQGMYTAYLQDLQSVVHLTNNVRQQLNLTSKLTTLV